MDLSFATLSFPKANSRSRQQLAPVLPEISTVEGQIFKLKKGNLKHTKVPSNFEEDAQGLGFSSQKSKTKRISFKADVTLEPSAPASTFLAPQSELKAVSRVTSRTIVKKKKKKQSKSLSQSPVRATLFARKSGPVGATASSSKSVKSIRATSTPSKNAKTVRAVSVASTSKSTKTIASSLRTRSTAAPSKESTFKLNVLKAPVEKAKTKSKEAKLTSESRPKTTRSANPLPKAANPSTRMPIIKAPIPTTAPPLQESKTRSLTNPRGTCVDMKPKRFDTAPAAGFKGQSNFKKSKSAVPSSQASEPSPSTAVSIELTPGLAETLIPTKLKPEVSEPKIKLPPCPDFQICTAYPGTLEWDEYWKKFNASMEQYSEGMVEYERGMEAFSEDLNRNKAAAGTVSVEEQRMKSKDGQKIGLEEVGIIPDFVCHKLDGLHVLNGYIVKGRGFRGTVSSIPGEIGGMRVEIDVGGIDPETMLTQKEHNMLTLSTSASQFVRIGCPDGVMAADLEIWPFVNGILMVDGP